MALRMHRHAHTYTHIHTDQCQNYQSAQVCSNELICSPLPANWLWCLTKHRGRGNPKWQEIKNVFSPTVWDGTRMNRAFLCHLEAENAQDEGKLLWSTRYFHINFEITHPGGNIYCFFVLSQFNYFCFHPLHRAFWWGCLSCPETYQRV